MHALSGLTPSPFSPTLPTEPTPFAEPTVWALHLDDGHRFMHGLLYALLFEAAGVSLLFAVWKLI